MGTTLIILVILGFIGFLIAIGGIATDNDGLNALGMIITTITAVALAIIGVIYLVCWVVLITNAAIVTVNG